MKVPKHIIPLEEHSPDGTAAPRFHLSDTLNWSCYSARIKNQVIVIPKPVYKYSNEFDATDSIENTIANDKKTS